MNNPQLLLIKLLFENVENDRGTVININGCTSVELDEEPVIEKKLDFLNGIEYNVLRESTIKIVVKYGNEGIRLDDEIQSTSSIPELGGDTNREG